MPRKILIVEDETNIADLINLYLKKEGYETMVANDGGKALELYRLFRPDLVLLDFAGSGNDFEVSDEEINIGVSIQKGNTALVDAINAYLKDKTADDFNALMAEAIKVQPLNE